MRPSLLASLKPQYVCVGGGAGKSGGGAGAGMGVCVEHQEGRKGPAQICRPSTKACVMGPNRSKKATKGQCGDLGQAADYDVALELSSTRAALLRSPLPRASTARDGTHTTE